MKKTIFLLAIIVATVGTFSFKSANESEEQMVSLENYRINKENFTKAMCDAGNGEVPNAKWRTGAVVKAVGYALIAFGEWLAPIMKGPDAQLPAYVVEGLEEAKILEKL